MSVTEERKIFKLAWIKIFRDNPQWLRDISGNWGVTLPSFSSDQTVNSLNCSKPREPKQSLIYFLLPWFFNGLHRRCPGARHVPSAGGSRGSRVAQTMQRWDPEIRLSRVTGWGRSGDTERGETQSTMLASATFRKNWSKNILIFERPWSLKRPIAVSRWLLGEIWSESSENCGFMN